MAIPSTVTVQELDLDVTNYEIVVAYSEQYESEVSMIRFNLYDSAIPIQIDDGATISLKGTKPDGTLLIYENDGVSNVISYTTGTNIVDINIVQQMTTVDGRVKFSLEVYLNNERKFPYSFYLRVRKATLDERAIKSKDDYKDLKMAILAEDIYYKNEMKDMIKSLDGALIQKGSVNTVDNLPDTTSELINPGFTYDVKTGFYVTDKFIDYDPTKPTEEQKYYSDGTNVYLTIDRKWDALSGTMSMEETVDIDFEHDWNTQS